MSKQNRFGEAATHFEQAVRIRPDAPAYYSLGLAQVIQGKGQEAITALEQAIKLKPDWPNALNDLAWILATHPAPELRNGARAVALAEQACHLTEFQKPLFVGTLAAAYAEAGQFDQAAKSAEQAIQLATSEGKPELADRNRKLLTLYRANKPYHEAANP